MSGVSGAAGLAALSICESILLSLTETGVIDADEARGILEDAATAHREVAPWADGAGTEHAEAGTEHAEAATLIEQILKNGNSVRRTRPDPDADDVGPGTLAS